MKYLIVVLGVLLVVAMLINILQVRQFTKAENLIYWIVFAVYIILVFLFNKKRKPIAKP